MIITIDGPSVSGKSTVARGVAKELNLFYIASGSIYRGLAYALMQVCGYTHDTIAQAQEADVMYCLQKQRFIYEYTPSGAEHIIFDDIDITPHIKSPEISLAASLVGTNAMVRKHILIFIRMLAQHHSLVIDGRDCGSVMFPNADYKFYLTASLDARAHRFQGMQMQRNEPISLDKAREIIAARDERDSTRSNAPLIKTSDSIMIDSSALQAQDVIEIIINYVRKQKKEEA